MANRIGWATTEIKFGSFSIPKYTFLEVIEYSAYAVRVVFKNTHCAITKSQITLFPEPAPEPDELIRPKLDYSVSSKLDNCCKGKPAWLQGSPVCEECGNFLNGVGFVTHKNACGNAFGKNYDLQFIYPNNHPLLHR